MRLTIGAVVFVVLAAAISASDVTLTGIVSDAACGVEHHGRDAAECVRSCAEEGSEFALVVGSRVYTLVGEDDVKAQLLNLAGKVATVTGDRGAGDVVSVATVQPGRPAR